MLKIEGLVLASSSKYRLALLEQIGVVPGEVVSPNIDESLLKGDCPGGIACAWRGPKRMQWRL